MWSDDDDDDGREITKRTQAFRVEVQRDAFGAFEHLYRLVRQQEQQLAELTHKVHEMTLASARFQGGVRLLGAIALASVGTIVAAGSWAVSRIVEHDRVNAEHEIRINANSRALESESSTVTSIRSQLSQQEATLREQHTILESMDARTQRIEQHLDRRPR